MIHPSYVDLMNVVNKDAAEGETPIINSRYSIVMATAKRARQIVDGDAPMVDEPAGRKPLSIAVDELQQEQLHILAQSEEELEEIEQEELRESKSLEAEIGRRIAAEEFSGEDDGNDESSENHEDGENDGADQGEPADEPVTE